MALVEAVSAAELVDDGAGPDTRPSGSERDGFRVLVEQAQIGEPVAAVGARALERERIGAAVLPAPPYEDGILPGQLVIDAPVGALAVAAERKDLTICAEPAV